MKNSIKNCHVNINISIDISTCLTSVPAKKQSQGSHVSTFSFAGYHVYCLRVNMSKIVGKSMPKVIDMPMNFDMSKVKRIGMSIYQRSLASICQRSLTCICQRSLKCLCQTLLTWTCLYQAWIIEMSIPSLDH